MNKICKLITLLLLGMSIICLFLYMRYHMKLLAKDNKRYLNEINRLDERIF